MLLASSSALKAERPVSPIREPSRGIGTGEGGVLCEVKQRRQGVSNTNLGLSKHSPNHARNVKTGGGMGDERMADAKKKKANM